jgi:hypothetical protein
LQQQLQVYVATLTMLPAGSVSEHDMHKLPQGPRSSGCASSQLCMHIIDHDIRYQSNDKHVKKIEIFCFSMLLRNKFLVTEVVANRT